METIIDYDLLQKIINLDSRRDNELNDFGYNTCCDYVDSLVKNGNKYGVVVFVEPCGDITKWGLSWDEVLDWWEKIFQSQPENWDYVTAGWHLSKLDPLPDDPEKVWPIIIEAAPNNGVNPTPSAASLPGVSVAEDTK